MKPFLILALISLTTVAAQAQTHKPFRVELGVVLGNSLDNEATSGWGGYLEPRFAANDHWLFGFRFEGTSLNGSSITIDLTEVEVSNTNIRNRSVFAEYFFTSNKVRPFVGLAGGFYTRKAVGVSVGAAGIQIGELGESTSNFGFAPRIGINAGHFRVSANANFTGKNIADYFGFGLGFEIGGGRKNKNQD